MIYLIGSMKNPNIPKIANTLREDGHDVFDDWFSPGPEADDRWQAYEADRGRTFAEALAGAHAQTVFNFDLTHLQRADTVVLVLPAGKSAHIELGWSVGQGKRAYVLLDGEPERFDIMYNFADKVFSNLPDLADELAEKAEHLDKLRKLMETTAPWDDQMTTTNSARRPWAHQGTQYHDHFPGGSFYHYHDEDGRAVEVGDFPG